MNDNEPDHDAAKHERWHAWCEEAKEYDHLERLLEEVRLCTGFEIWTGYDRQGDWFSINGQEFRSIRLAKAYCQRILEAMVTRH